MGKPPISAAFGGEKSERQSCADFHARGLGDSVVRYHGWGIGYVMGHSRVGGIYMASNVDNSCQLYNALIEDPRMIGHLGNCEHLRPFLGPEPILLKAGGVV